VAVTAGTSGVVYGITDKANHDKLSRVNTFIHVNNTEELKRYGVLLCLNGTGILNSWLKHNLAAVGAENLSYEQMNELAGSVEPGSEGLFIYPYGNGAERTLANRNIGAAVSGWNFNIHKKPHFLRAGQEGIVFALNYGLEIMRQMGMKFDTVRAGHANMFLSPIFASVFASLTNSSVQLYNTDGSQGAARAAGVGCGLFGDYQQAFEGLKPVKIIEPDDKLSTVYEQIYQKWKDVLTNKLLIN
jgi:xylulokinase